MKRYSGYLSVTGFICLFLIFFAILPSSLPAQNQATQSLSLKAGYNFISFKLNPASTPGEFIQSCAGACEDIYLYSASAGGFLSASEGTLTTLGTGKGYIIKMKADYAASVAGTAVSTLGALNLKAGFNLVGFSKAPSSDSFSRLMKKFPFILGIYKWNVASGSFIQVVSNGADPQILDGVDPSLAPEQSYFINLSCDTILDLDGLAVSFGGGAAAVNPGTAKSVDLGGGVKLDMVYIPAGTFTMGHPRATAESFDQQHTVRITRGFYMAKFETTQAQWQAIMGNNPSTNTGNLNLPVEEVSWNDICSPGGFIDKLNRKGMGVFRLPTEAEWEYACRAGSTSEFYWGDIFDGGYCWYSSFSEGNSGQTTHPVGQKKPNSYGLYDMNGNVMEWCCDWYWKYNLESQDDPAGPTEMYIRSVMYVNDYLKRVMRGGGNKSNPDACSSVYRSEPRTPDTRFNDGGFRVVMSPDTPTYYLIKSSDSIMAGGTYDLGALLMQATFPTGVSQTVMPSWRVVSGGGTIGGETGGTNYFAPAVPGVAILQASYIEAGVTRTANFTMNITTDITSITISGGTSVAAGKTLQLTATAVNSKGSVVSGRTVAWTSLSPLIATISPSGLVSGISAGPAVIRAAIDGKSQEVTITVTSLPARVIDLGGGVSLEMVYVPAGTFVMGTPDSEYGHVDTSLNAEGPQHTVNITRGFYIGKFEVTQAQWKAVMGNREFPLNVDNYPANTIRRSDIFDAGGFLDVLNRKSIGTFSLPTEAQWEYACRAGTKTAYYWGDAMNGDYCLYSENYKGDGSVGQKIPNAWGLYDMSGSVVEWCRDGLAYYSASTVNDPVGPDYNYVLQRGGSVSSVAVSCRSGCRIYNQLSDCGFRLFMADDGVEKVMVGMKLSNGTDSVFVNQSYDLSKISANIQYTGETLGTPHIVTPQWSVKSGPGTVAGASFTAPAAPGTTILTASFTESGRTVSADFIITTENPSVTATVGPAGGVVSGEGLSYSIPAGAFTDPTQVMISKTTPPAGISVPLIGDCYKISAFPANFSGEISFVVDVKDVSQLNNDTYFLMSFIYESGNKDFIQIKGNLENSKLKFSLKSPDTASAIQTTINRASKEMTTARVEAAVSSDWKTMDFVNGISNQIFSLTYHRSIEAFNGHIALRDAINEAYIKMNAEVGLDWKFLNGDKCPIIISPYYFIDNTTKWAEALENINPVDFDIIISYRAVYSKYCVLVNPNMLTSSTLTSMKIALAHEMFHILTAYHYGSASWTWSWFDDAGATWFERIVTHPAGYVPDTVSPTQGLKSDNFSFLIKHGLENGDRAESANFGYGASMFITYLTTHTVSGSKIVASILDNRYNAKSTILPCDAIQNALGQEGRSLSELWLDFCKNYALGNIYDDVKPFPDTNNILSINKSTICRFTSCNEAPKLYNLNIPDLSAQFYTLMINYHNAEDPEWPENASVYAKFSFDKAAEQNISIFEYNVSEDQIKTLTFIGEMKNDVEKSYKVSDMVGRKNVKLYMVVNNRAVTPYTGAISVNCTMQLDNNDRVIDLGGGTKLELKSIRAATFTMGTSDLNSSKLQPAHKVQLTKNFYIGKYEFTVAQWQAIMGAASMNYSYTERNYPAYGLSWNDICGPGNLLEKLNQRNLGKFRLPTEAEWEYACRAGSSTSYYFPDTDSPNNYMWHSGNANGGKEIIYDTIIVGDQVVVEAGIYNNPVGLKIPNKWGLYDMYGNVSEWCSDWFASYPTDALTIDPTGPGDNAGKSLKVLRGGGWRRSSGECNSYFRICDNPVNPSPNYGFRVVMEE